LASFAQSASHATVQQVLSMAHVLEQHEALLQPGVSCGDRQSPVAGHDCATAEVLGSRHEAAVTSARSKS